MRAGAARGIRDLAGRLIEHAVIEGLQANTDILSFHVQLPMRKSHGAEPQTKIPRHSGESRNRIPPGST